MKRSTWLIGALLGIGLLAAAAAYLWWPRRTLPPDPLAVVPADAYGFVRLRVDRVIASEAYQRLLVERGQTAWLERVKVTCGFDPLAQLSEAVVFARRAPEGGAPRLAFAARGALDHAALLACAKKLGEGESELVQEDVDGVATVRSKTGRSRAAFLGRDAIVGGDSESVLAALHALAGKAPSMAADPLLSGLFRELEQGTDATLVARLPDELRPLLRRAAELGGPELAQLEQLRVLGATLSSKASRLVAGAVLIMHEPTQASALVALAQRAKESLLAIPAVSLTPAAGVLHGLQLEARAERATFAGAVKVGTIEALLELAPALRVLSGASARTHAAPTTDDAGTSAPDAGSADVPPRRSRRRAR